MSQTKEAAKQAQQDERWHLVDAKDQVLGRLATRVAGLLTGKYSPRFERHRNTGDHVVIINASQIRLTGRKAEQKTYKSYSGYPSGLKETPFRRMIARKPTYPVWHAVKGMLPKTSLGNRMLMRMHVYAEANHPHSAQKPEPIQLNQRQR